LTPSLRATGYKLGIDKRLQDLPAHKHNQRGIRNHIPVSFSNINRISKRKKEYKYK